MLFKMSRSVFPLKVRCSSELEQTSEYRLSGIMLHRFNPGIFSIFFFSKLKKYIYIFDLFLNSLLLLCHVYTRALREQEHPRVMQGEFISVCRVPENPGVLRAARPSSTSRLLPLTLPLISSFNFLQLGKTMERCIKGPHEGPRMLTSAKTEITHTHTHFPVQQHLDNSSSF